MFSINIFVYIVSPTLSRIIFHHFLVTLNTFSSQKVQIMAYIQCHHPRLSCLLLKSSCYHLAIFPQYLCPHFIYTVYSYLMILNAFAASPYSLSLKHNLFYQPPPSKHNYKNIDCFLNVDKLAFLSPLTHNSFSEYSFPLLHASFGLLLIYHIHL